MSVSQERVLYLLVEGKKKASKMEPAVSAKGQLWPQFHLKSAKFPCCWLFFLGFAREKMMAVVKTPINLRLFRIKSVWSFSCVGKKIFPQKFSISLRHARACDHRSHESLTGAHEFQAEWEKYVGFVSEYWLLRSCYYLFQLCYERVFPECHCWLSLTHKEALAFVWRNTVSTISNE